MDAQLVVNSLGIGCLWGFILFLIFLLADKPQKYIQHRISLPQQVQNLLQYSFMAILAASYTLVSIWHMDTVAHDKPADFNSLSIIAVMACYALLWMFGAFGTGKLDETRSEADQMRERAYIFAAAIIGDMVAALIGTGYLM